MRTFVGIMAGGELQQLATTIINQLCLQSKLSGIHWQAAEKLHITLQFLGDIRPNQVHNLQQQLSVLADYWASFFIKPTHVQIFPSVHKPLVIALCFEPNPKLVELANAVKLCAMDAGLIVDSHIFKAHLTLGRIKEPHPVTFDGIILPIDLTFPIKQITLIESKRHASGSEYVPIQHFNFAR